MHPNAQLFNHWLPEFNREADDKFDHISWCSPFFLPQSHVGQARNRAPDLTTYHPWDDPPRNPLVMTFTVRHGKSTHAIKFGKASISMGHLDHGYVSHNQRVTIDFWDVAHRETSND